MKVRTLENIERWMEKNDYENLLTIVRTTKNMKENKGRRANQDNNFRFFAKRKENSLALTDLQSQSKWFSPK